MNNRIHKHGLFLVIVLLTAGLFSSCNDPLNPMEGVDVPKPGDVTARADLTVSVENPSGTLSAEGSSKLVDGKKFTKFLIFNYTSDFWVQQTFDKPVKIDAYTMTAGNDAPARDPQSWVLKGSNDGVSWTVLDSKSNVNFGLRNKTQIYHLKDSTEVSYQYYHLSITANGGSSLMQLSEWRLLNYGSQKNDSTATDTTTNIEILKIRSLSSTVAPVKSELIITGINFGSSASANTVMIGGTEATILDAASQEITIKVPANLEYKKYVVYVKSNGQVAASPVALSVVSNAPKIASVTPNEASAGSEVKINGANFSSNSSDLTVTFGNKQTKIVSSTEKEIVAIVPDGLSIGPVPITVKVDGVSEVATTSEGSFNYILAFVPVGGTWKWTNYVDNYQDLKWTKISYNDNDWDTGQGPFGSGGYGGESNTEWTGWDLYLRQAFTIDNLSALKSGNGTFYVKAISDDVTDIFINGVRAVHIGCCNGDYQNFDLSQESIDALKNGKNIIAVHTHEGGGGQVSDVGLYFK